MHQIRSVLLNAIMRKKRWMVSVPLVLVLLWISIVGLAAAQAPTGNPDETIMQGERDLDAIEQRVDSLSTQLAGDNAERQALIAELEERERDVAALAIAGRELAEMVREQNRVATDLRDRLGEQKQVLGVELSRLSELLRTAYAMGRADGLRLLLNQEDPTRASRVMSYFAYFNRERLHRIQAVESSAERLAVLARDAEQEAGRLEELAEQQDATRARLEAAKGERTQVLAELEQTIAGREEDMAELRVNAENLRRLVEHLRQKAEIRAELDVHRDPFQARKGLLRWPLLEGRIRTAFGSAKDDSGLVWEGVLLESREGEEVRAIYDGRVVHADWMRGFGMLLVIDHGDGYLSIYGHNEALLKEVGEWVAANEVVALSGVSGGRGDAVLFFAIRHQSVALDPAAWCD